VLLLHTTILFSEQTDMATSVQAIWSRKSWTGSLDGRHSLERLTPNLLVWPRLLLIKLGGQKGEMRKKGDLIMCLPPSKPHQRTKRATLRFDRLTGTIRQFAGRYSSTDAS
jgi:hypothetical protein